MNGRHARKGELVLEEDDRGEEEEEEEDEEDEDVVAPRKFLAKDGVHYDTYVEMAQANKRHNDKRLDELGLLGAFHGASSQTSSKKSSTRTEATLRLSRTRAKTLSSPPRRSDRVQGREPGGGLRRKKQTTVKHRVVKKPRAKPRTSSSATAPEIVLTEPQRQRLAKEFPNWIPLLESYLLQVQGVSKANCAQVVRQIQKLASGQGIGYLQWPKKVVFYQDQRLTLASNLEQAIQEAVEYEDRHGRDLGNGWLLRHPLRKLELFQQHCHAQLQTRRQKQNNNQRADSRKSQEPH